MAVPDSLLREIVEFLSSRRAIKAKQLPANLIRAMRDAGIRESAARTAGRLALAMPMPGRTRRGAPIAYDGMSTTRRVAAGEPLDRARYIVAAAQRLSKAAEDRQLKKALALEQAYARLHLLAGRNRRVAAAKLDAVAARSSTGWLVWRAMLDERTTPDCARLDGRLFQASDPPGIPGAMHPRCRCSAQPWVGLVPR